MLSATNFLQTAIERTFRELWASSSDEEAGRVADTIARSGVSFDEALARLKAGRDYRNNVATGIVPGRHRLGNQDFFYTLDVPKTYDPSRRYPVRFHLHGGVTAREENRPLTSGVRRPRRRRTDLRDSGVVGGCAVVE